MVYYGYSFGDIADGPLPFEFDQTDHCGDCGRHFGACMCHDVTEFCAHDQA